MGEETSTKKVKHSFSITNRENILKIVANKNKFDIE